MSRKTWILVANSSFARVLCNDGPKKGLRLVSELDHPQSREKRMDLTSDKPGRVDNKGHGSFVQQTDPKKNEADHFALEVAKNLELGRVNNDYDRLILIASNPFMGLLKNRLDSHVMDRVSETIEKDYTKASDKELAAHLEQVLYLELPQARRKVRRRPGAEPD
jgi:protein required for attachment to host cells